MDSFHTIPIGSIYSRKNIVTMEYLDIVATLPDSINNLVASLGTASYIRGLARTYDIPEEQIPPIAFAILEVSVGKKTLAQLPAIFSTELKIPNDRAQKMAAEIEKDIFEPVKAQLDEFLRKQKLNSNSITSRVGMVSPKAAKPMQNVLNLKELPSRRPQVALPQKPVQKDFPVRPEIRKPLPPSPLKPAGEQRFPLPPKSSNPPIRFT